MKRFLDEINVLNEMFGPYILFPHTDSDNVDTYGACINALGHSSKAIERFAVMKRPEAIEDRYLMVWGVLQAIIIQQDSLRGLHCMFVEKIEKKKYGSGFEVWHDLRKLRDAVAGHPTGIQYKNAMTTFAINDEWGVYTWFPEAGTLVHPYICNLLPRYELELLEAFNRIVLGLQKRADEVQLEVIPLLRLTRW